VAKLGVAKLGVAKLGVAIKDAGARFVL